MYKIAVIGSAGCGKTSWIRRLFGETIQVGYVSDTTLKTYVFDMYEIDVYPGDLWNRDKVDYTLYDGIVYMFDKMNHRSYNYVRYFIECCNIPYIIVATKDDGNVCKQVGNLTYDVSYSSRSPDAPVRLLMLIKEKIDFFRSKKE